MKRVGLALGPVLFNWRASKWRDFYRRIAEEAPVDTVYLGEVICSKREPFYAAAIADAAAQLRAAGKTVVFSTLALVTQPRERKLSAGIALNSPCEIEVNDLSVLNHIPKGHAFRLGPFVNVYNEDTLEYLAKRGAKGICLPPELSIEAASLLAKSACRLGVQSEVWAFGRIPLAISSRCYHARLCGLTKDSCQFVCLDAPDGKLVDTLDGGHFLAINGVQAMSSSYCNLIGDTGRLFQAGFDSLRLSPQDCDMVEVIRLFRDRLDGKIGAGDANARLAAVCGEVSFSNGFLFGAAGMDFVSTEAPGPPDSRVL